MGNFAHNWYILLELSYFGVAVIVKILRRATVGIRSHWLKKFQLTLAEQSNCIDVCIALFQIRTSPILCESEKHCVFFSMRVRLALYLYAQCAPPAKYTEYSRNIANKIPTCSCGLFRINYNYSTTNRIFFYLPHDNYSLDVHNTFTIHTYSNRTTTIYQLIDTDCFKLSSQRSESYWCTRMLLAVAISVPMFVSI